ncbi:expressed unknown protein [Seminavis robusta]|uniref:PAS domain-containing protein n=1 Tax=Seminavis robusta TaxID=568900 RepID=A0A9N8EC32_9STRA|nr:expressed unknown protein [Seminavis robusta]|eukprot:Sro905_g218520.1 n/a (350) ;mRNA; f:18438-19487
MVRRAIHTSSMSPSAAASALAARQCNPLNVSANCATVEAEWLLQYLFASPEDLTATQQTEDDEDNDIVNTLHLQVSANSATMESEWAQQITLANARQDVEALERSLHAEDDNTTTEESIMEQLHLNVPESALGVVHAAEYLDEAEQEQVKQLFAQQDKDIPQALPPNDAALDSHAVELMVQQMLLSSPESATGYYHVAETLTDDLKKDLATAATPLPTTLEDAMSEDESRAIVITTPSAPFRVVRVNTVWEGLCGYSQEEVQERPIGELLKGPKTQVAQDMVHALEEHPETPQATTIVNYTRDGRQFRNHLQVGPLFATLEHEQVVEYLVGVLREVDEEGHSVQRRVAA